VAKLAVLKTGPSSAAQSKKMKKVQKLNTLSLRTARRVKLAGEKKEVPNKDFDTLKLSQFSPGLERSTGVADGSLINTQKAGMSKIPSKYNYSKPM